MWRIRTCASDTMPDDRTVCRPFTLKTLLSAHDSTIHPNVAVRLFLMKLPVIALILLCATPLAGVPLHAQASTTTVGDLLHGYTLVIDDTFDRPDTAPPDSIGHG